MRLSVGTLRTLVEQHELWGKLRSATDDRRLASTTLLLETLTKRCIAVRSAMNGAELNRSVSSDMSSDEVSGGLWAGGLMEEAPTPDSEGQVPHHQTAHS